MKLNWVSGTRAYMGAGGCGESRRPIVLVARLEVIGGAGVERPDRFGLLPHFTVEFAGDPNQGRGEFADRYAVEINLPIVYAAREARISIAGGGGVPAGKNATDYAVRYAIYPGAVFGGSLPRQEITYDLELGAVPTPIPAWATHIMSPIDYTVEVTAAGYTIQLAVKAGVVQPLGFFAAVEGATMNAFGASNRTVNLSGWFPIVGGTADQ